MKYLLTITMAMKAINFPFTASLANLSPGISSDGCPLTRSCCTALCLTVWGCPLRMAGMLEFRFSFEKVWLKAHDSMRSRAFYQELNRLYQDNFYVDGHYFTGPAASENYHLTKQQRVAALPPYIDEADLGLLANNNRRNTPPPHTQNTHPLGGYNLTHEAVEQYLLALYKKLGIFNFLNLILTKNVCEAQKTRVLSLFVMT